ncbi:MAG: 5'/3'-nucleotidase SurE [Bacteroidia bacterium]|nr:5'/3'-nucleotidase SurE [Bacteroidia bacterium]MCZ2248106.1 5'/3'-nucleotidase SurE [Bacteroidia bacterium]
MKEERPLILVTNDDGVYAPGIRALVECVRNKADVLVIAPDKPQSGMGHAITINSTLRIHKIKEEPGYSKYSCSGTPVDCVKVAVSRLLPRKPDLCISGINHGSNSSINVIYSGTMSAAVEGCIEGIPSIGFSLCNFSVDANFDASKKIAERVIEKILQSGLPEGVCLNVNIPNVEYDKLNGIKICRQAKATWVEELDERKDPMGHSYYWLSGVFQSHDNGEDTDEWSLANQWVSVVPVHIDFTAHHTIPYLKKLNF